MKNVSAQWTIIGFQRLTVRQITLLEWMPASQFASLKIGRTWLYMYHLQPDEVRFSSPPYRQTNESKSRQAELPRPKRALPLRLSFHLETFGYTKYSVICKNIKMSLLSTTKHHAQFAVLSAAVAENIFLLGLELDVIRECVMGQNVKETTLLFGRHKKRQPWEWWKALLTIFRQANLNRTLMQHFHKQRSAPDEYHVKRLDNHLRNITQNN